MLNQPSQPRSPSGPAKEDNSTQPEIVDREVTIDPAAIGIDPVAYRYESWSEMAGGWTTSLRSARTVPDHDRIRHVTPLVALSDVEAIVRRMIRSEEAVPFQGSADPTETEVNRP